MGHSDPTIITAAGAMAAKAAAPVNREAAQPLAAAAAPRSHRGPPRSRRGRGCGHAVGAGVVLYQRHAAGYGNVCTSSCIAGAGGDRHITPDSTLGLAYACGDGSAETRTRDVDDLRVGLIDPADPRYQTTRHCCKANLRADSKSQVVEKAVGLLLERLARQELRLLKDRLPAKSGSFIKTVVARRARMGKDGLMSSNDGSRVTSSAYRNRSTRCRRRAHRLIRASGDPKVSVRSRCAMPISRMPRRSILGRKISPEAHQIFGFRTGRSRCRRQRKRQSGDFAVIGEPRSRAFHATTSLRLMATKQPLTSWTVKCIDRER